MLTALLLYRRYNSSRRRERGKDNPPALHCSERARGREFFRDIPEASAGGVTRPCQEFVHVKEDRRTKEHYWNGTTDCHFARTTAIRTDQHKVMYRYSVLCGIIDRK